MQDTTIDPPQEDAPDINLFYTPKSELRRLDNYSVPTQHKWYIAKTAAQVEVIWCNDFHSERKDAYILDIINDITNEEEWCKKCGLLYWSQMRKGQKLNRATPSALTDGPFFRKILVRILHPKYVSTHESRKWILNHLCEVIMFPHYFVSFPNGLY
jgi:hypothetical protein